MSQTQNNKSSKQLPDPKELRLLPRRTVFPQTPDSAFPRTRQQAYQELARMMVSADLGEPTEAEVDAYWEPMRVERERRQRLERSIQER